MTKYLLVLHGAKDPQPESVQALKTNIGTRFKLSEKAVQALFEHLPVKLKRGLDEEQVRQYQKAFEQIGAIIEVVPEEEAPATTPLFQLEEETPTTSAVAEVEIQPTEKPRVSLAAVTVTKQAMPSAPPPHMPAIVEPIPLPPSAPVVGTSDPGSDIALEIQAADELFSRPAPPRVSPKKFMIFSAIVLLSVVMLFFTFFNKPSAVDISSKEVIGNLLQEQKQILPRTKPQPKPVSESPSVIWHGEADDAQTISSIDIVSQDSDLSELRLHVQSVPPPALTPEEFVAGKKRLPWISRFDVQFSPEEWKATVSDSSPAVVSFNAEKTEKIYLEDDASRGRTVAICKIAGSWNKDGTTLSGKWSLYDTGQTDPASVEPFSQRLTGGKFAFLFRGEFQAPVVTPTSQPVASPPSVPHPATNE